MTMTKLAALALSATALGVFLPTFAQDVIDMDGLDPVFPERPYSPYADRAFPENVYFGDTHVHTGLSGDAGGGGTRLMPRDAYRFARGEQVTSNTGQQVKLRTPFDFFMITDHSDGMGAITDMIAGKPNILADPDGKKFHEAFSAGGEQAQAAAIELTRQFAQGELSAALNYQPGNPAYKRIWDDIMQAAEEFNDPGRFTTFIAFEWTSLEKGNNLHRNVIFRDGPERAGQIVPYTTTPPLGSRDPRDLWQWLEDYEARTGGDVTAIPHNGNLSNGMMFALQDDFAHGASYDAGYAEQRNKWERLYEATQIKGDGEAHPLLSPDDEFASFENWDWGNLDISAAKTAEMLPGEYVRSGLQRGLQLENELGTNPFKFGVVGAGDAHTALATPDNDNFYGKFTAYEPNKHRSNHLSKQNKDLGGASIIPGVTLLRVSRPFGLPATHAARFSMPWSDVRSMPPPDHAFVSASLVAVILNQLMQNIAIWHWSAIAGAFPWVPTCIPARARLRSWSMRCAIRWAPASTGFRSSRAGLMPRAIRRRKSTTWPGQTSAYPAMTVNCHLWAALSIWVSPAGPIRSARPSLVRSGLIPIIIRQ